MVEVRMAEKKALDWDFGLSVSVGSDIWGELEYAARGMGYGCSLLVGDTSAIDMVFPKKHGIFPFVGVGLTPDRRVAGTLN